MRPTLSLFLTICCFAIQFGGPWSSGSSQLAAQEIGFLEDFVLAKDREKVLKQLVPGTEPYYYFHALHYQTKQELDQVDELLAAWVKRFGETEQLKQIRNRQALLRYSKDPEATLKYLTEQLNLYFNHQREIPQAQRELPTKLDANLISDERLIARAIANHQNTNGFRESGLYLLANLDLNKIQRRHLLERLTHPDFPGLVELIVTDLKERDSRGFGSLSIHGALTQNQLDDLASKFPQVKLTEEFVNIYLTKLYPSEDVNWQSNRDAHQAYLARLWSFVQTLNPNFNSLKANILFRQLDLDREAGIYNRERFIEYLKLPRQVGYINPTLVKNAASRNHIVNLGADYFDRIVIRPIINDEPLIRDYLHHFLVDADDPRDFEAYVKEDYLRQQFAIVKILHGIGETEKWASMLTPEQYKEVIDRVDVEFLSTNPEFFQVDDQVELEMYLKHVDNLIVKVFEINTSNYYRKHQQEIDTDVNLDGLVPNFEETFTYDEPPALRKKRTFKFPQIKDRGVYVVDFIAGGKSSRALIRKGRLQITSQVTAAGQRFSVIDQSGAIVTDANLWIGGARYYPTPDGTILVPFSTNPGTVNAIITEGNFSSLQSFQHIAEAYDFKAAMVLDREQLTRSNTAKILIRPSLQIVDGNPVPVGLLENPKLVITSINLDGIATTKTIDDLKLAEKTETICEFVVPPRVKTISLMLTAEIKNVSRNKVEAMTAAQHYSINGIDLSDSIQDVHLVPTERGYFLELLGKSGEIRPGQSVRIGVEMEHFESEISVDLQTDEKGLIELGPLTDVRSLVATPIGGTQKNWEINTQDQTYYRTIHALQGKPIELPAPAGIVDANREHISLMEIRRGTFVADYFKAVSVTDGLIRINDLDPGDYQLRLSYLTQNSSTYHHEITIRVTAGQQAGNALVGADRQLESRGNQALHVAKVTTSDDKIRVQLDNADEFTRVHVIANRYQPAFSAFREFSQIRDLEPWVRQQSIRRSVYMEGRKIGDEYEYILRRKLADKYPGNMLERPSLLLNPWDVKTTSNDAQDAQAGSDYRPTGNAADDESKRSDAKSEAALQFTDFANLDFLGERGVWLANLKPQKNGVVTIDRAALGPNQHIRLIVVNAFNTIQRKIDLPLMKLNPRDARLANALDPNQHFSQSKQTEILKQGETLVIEDVVSAKFQQYDDLRDVFQLMQTLNSGTELPKFEFILSWLDKPEKEKRQLYSKFACHELSFFLMKKDPQFFESVIVPHLKNKRDKTFMDNWLLKQDLAQYATPWQYARLNTVEKILLAQRTEDRSADIVRNINEQYLLNPTKRMQFDLLYDTTIRGLGMDSAFGKDRGISRGEDLPELAMLGRTLSGAMADQEVNEPADGAGMGSGGGGGYGGQSVKRLEQLKSAPSPGQPMFGMVDSLERESVNGETAVAGDRFRNATRNSLGEDLIRLSDPRSANKKDKDGRMETRSRMVPVTKYRTETRTRSRPDGTTEVYTVQVPYTEMVTQNYTVQVPETVNYFAINELGILREQSKNLYRRLSPTQEWMENNYYRLLPDQQTADLVPTNRFWRDFANHDGSTFLSPYFSESHRTFTEMMFALAVLDLPLNEPKQKFDYVDNTMTLTAGGPTIALHQQVRSSIVERGNTTILVSENFFRKDDRYRHEDGIQYDKFVSDEFLAHTLYGSQVVITNPTSTPRAIDLLIQIPRGSVACSGAQETRTIQMDLEAFSTQTFEYAFYFPTAGDFQHYPAHVSADEKVLAVADPVTFDVIDRPAKVDETSWAYISQNGSDDQVIEFLNQNNVLRLPLEKIAFRMKDKTFFQRAIETLRNRFAFNATLWSYAIKHNDADTIREFLTDSDSIVRNVGYYFDSELLSIDPVDRNWYSHKEYWPLVNDRAHQLGPQRKILNPEFFSQYNNLLTVLANRQELTNDDHLILTYYMLLQDRIDTALEEFSKIARDNTAAQIQYDYCDAYLDLYREQPDDAVSKAEKWVDYPVDHWRRRFENILAQVQEIQGGNTKVVDDKDQSQAQTQAAAESESFDFEIAAGKVKVNYQNLNAVVVNFYEMDIELLFSRSPFAQDEMDGFSMIRPNMTQTIELKTDDLGKGSHEFDLPAELANKNILVEIVAGDQTKSESHYAHSLDVQLLENYGQIHVTGENGGKPIPKTYIKVYARMADGSERFHKDGYTDLRGRFDYVSQSNRTIDGIQKFSILILSDQQGAVIRQADPPKE